MNETGYSVPLVCLLLFTKFVYGDNRNHIKLYSPMRSISKFQFCFFSCNVIFLIYFFVFVIAAYSDVRVTSNST